MKLLQLKPDDLKPHPLLARMAMENSVIAYLGQSRDAEDAAELQRRADARAAFVEDIALNGVMEPIKVVAIPTGGWLIADGRHRWEASVQAGHATIPAVEVTEEQARRIIFSTVAHRRHLSKGAIAWLAVLLHPELADTKPGKPNSNSVGITRQTLAAQAGVSLPLVDQACELFRVSSKSAKLRERTDAAIAAGRGLGGLIAGLAGAGALPTGADGSPTRPEPGLKGFRRTLKTVGTQLQNFAGWGDLNREAAIAETADFLRANEAARELFAAAITAATAEPEASAE